MRLNNFFYLLILSFPLFSGCWDVVNIEDRGFVIGSAIDLLEQGENRRPDLRMTNQVVVPAGMTAPSIESGSGEKPFINYTSTGKSIFAMEKDLATLSSKVPYFEHLSVFVISEKVAQQEKLFSNILDTYIRDVNLRRGIKIAVSEGEAKDVLEFVSPNYKLPAIHVEELLEKSSEQVGFLKPLAAGDIEEFHLENTSYVLPYINTNEYLEYEKGAVFHGLKGKMVGLFNAEEMQGIGMILDEQTLKVIEFPYKGEAFSLSVVRYHSKMSVDPANLNNIKVTLDIEIEGVIKELIHQEDLTNIKAIESIREETAQHIKNKLEKVFHKGQHEFGTDVFGIWQQIETKHYKQWEQIKDEWETGNYYFKNVTFDINVRPEIYSTGTTKRTD